MKIQIALDHVVYTLSTPAEAKRGRGVRAEVPAVARKSVSSRFGGVGLEAEALANEKLIGAERMATLGMAGNGATIQRKDAAEPAEEPGFFDKYVVPIHDRWLKTKEWWAGASEEDKAKLSKDVLEKTKDELEGNPAYKVLRQHPKGKEFGEFVVDALEASADVARYGEAETWTERGKVALRTEVKWLKKYIDENYPEVGQKLDQAITAVNFTDDMLTLIRDLNEIETVRRLDDPDKKTELLEKIFGDLAKMTEYIPEGAPGVKEFKKVWKDAFLMMQKNAHIVVGAYYRSINYLEKEHVYREGDGYVRREAKEPPTVATQPQVERILSPEAAARQAAERKILNRFWTHRERLRWELCDKKGYHVVGKEYPELTKFDQETRRLRDELRKEFEAAWSAQRRLIELGELDTKMWAEYRQTLEPQWAEEQAKYWSAVEALARLTGDIPPTKPKSKAAPVAPARKSTSPGLATTGLEAEALANELSVARLASAIVTRHAAGPMLLMRGDGEAASVDERIKAFLTSPAQGPLALRIPMMSTRELTSLVRTSSVPGVDLLRDEAVTRIVNEWISARRTPSVGGGGASTSPGTGGLTAPPVGPASPSPLGTRLGDLGRFLGRIPTSVSLGDPRQLEFTAAPGGLTLAHQGPGLKLSAGMDWGRVFNAEAAYRDLRFSASADVLGGERQALSFGLQYGPDAPDVSGMGGKFQGAGQGVGHALVNVPRFVSYLREGGVEELRGIPDAVEQARRIAGERERRVPLSFGLTATVSREGKGPPGVAVTGNLTLAWDVLKKAQAGAAKAVSTSDVAPTLVRSSGRQLGQRLTDQMEGFFRRRLPPVRIHTGPVAEAAAAQLGAEAFTIGSDVYFGAGKYDPESKAGLGLLGHELTHVLQQRGGVASDGNGSFRVRRAREEIVGVQRAGGDTGTLEQQAEQIAQAIETASSAVASEALAIGAYRRTYRPTDGQPLTGTQRATLEMIAAQGRAVCEQLLRAEHPSVLTSGQRLPRLQMAVEIDLDATTPEAASQAWGRKMAEAIVTAIAPTMDAAARGPRETTAAGAPRIQRKIGWSDASTKGEAWNATPAKKDDLKAVGGIWRIPISELTGGFQKEAPTPKGQKDDKEKWHRQKGFTTESAKGRAIALVPKALDPKQKVEVFLHFHGYSGRHWDPYAGWRERESDATVRDVALDRIEQQLDAAGTVQTVGILPQGGLKSEFGEFKADPYVRNVLKEVAEGLVHLGVWRETAALEPTRIVVSAHSGGGHIVRRMIRDEAASLPSAVGELVLFDAINGDAELEAVKDWVDAQLKAARVLVKDAGKDDKTKRAEIASAPKLRGYYSSGQGYTRRYTALKTHICEWFTKHRTELGPYADALWANYQIMHVPGLKHEELMRGSEEGDESRPPGEGNIADALRALHAPRAREPLDKVCPVPTGPSTPAREPRKRKDRDSSTRRAEPAVPADASVAKLSRGSTKGKSDDPQEILTSQGRFQRFPAGAHRRNSSNRPLFRASKLKPYSGAGSGSGKDIHPAVARALNDLMSALIAEGMSTNDESMKQAVVASAYRPPTEGEGGLYLKALRKTIRQNPKIFGEHVLTPELEAMAQEELGFSGSSRHRAFRDAVAAAWGDPQLAAKLLSITAGFKAPRGGSSHHSGVVVDIDFPYVTEKGKVRWHGMNRERNADAFRSAAGQWLLEHAAEYGFASYNTEKEIWHQEWLQWRGTDADPENAGPNAAAPSVRPAAAEVKPVAPAKQRESERITGGTSQDAEKDADKKDPQIEALNLAETARQAAYVLKKTHPTIKFTSGRRDKHDQARAMAQNVVLNRKWIEETYSKSKARDACQKWLDAHPDEKTRAGIEAGLQSVLDGLTDPEVRRLSKHLAGEAFDVKPVKKDAETIEATIRALPGLKKFLEKEGGLVRWHAQF